MSEPAKKPSTALVNWSDELAKYAVEVAKSETPSSSTISLRSGILSYQGQPVPNNKLEVVILDSIIERTFYEGKFDPNNITSPVCFAFGRNDEELTPHEASAKPQHSDCDSCPRNQWGSSLNGGRGKACQERRKLALIPAATAKTGDEVLAAEVATVKLPVTSVKAWGGYVQNLAALQKRPPFAVITELGTKPDPKSQFVVTFRPVAALGDDVIPAILQKRDMVQPVLREPYSPPQEEAEDAAPAKGRKY